MNDESLPRQPGLQTNRLPTHARTVLVRVDDDEIPLWLAYYDTKKWRSLNRGYFKLPILGWIELDDAAYILDSVKSPAA